jgi:hypothetical protein
MGWNKTVVIMSRIGILVFFSTILCSCKGLPKATAFPKTDTVNVEQLFIDTNICNFVLANDFKEIKPSMISWAEDPNDPYSESYIINNGRLKIWQPLKRLDLPDSNRRYFYADKPIRSVRVLIDSLKFNFNNISLDYGYESKNIFQQGNFVLLRNEPVTWNGLANRYRFIQLFDLKKLICYEFFANYYGCQDKVASH